MSKLRAYISLDGDWEFAYSQQAPNIENMEFPQKCAYEVKMPVPGYWDDHVDRLQYTEFWSRDCKFNPEYRPIRFPMGAGKPADASLPYLLGTGWYKKYFHADQHWMQKTVTLQIGGVALEAWVWLNGQFVGHHLGHLTPFEMNLDQHLHPGELNELIIAVANTRSDRIGCSIRGFKGKSAGITRSVLLQVTDRTWIQDCYVRTDWGQNKLFWEVQLGDYRMNAAYKLFWEIYDPLRNQSIAKGCIEELHSQNTWTTEKFELEAWSDRHPRLYQLRLLLSSDEQLLDEYEQSFGLRYIEAKGRKLLLNGYPVLLRGLTDHAYFPETCTVPTSSSYYTRTLKILKSLGFNWIRFHTWTPPEECLNAADELGMLLQVEAPNGFLESDWLDILRVCRRHPSVVIYCCGNEVPLDDTMLDNLERMSQHCHQLVPDSLLNPMEGLHSVEYALDNEAPGYTEEPYPHDAVKLERMKTFSDVFAPHGSIFSYHSLATDDALMERRLAMHDKPCLMHEVGINDSYLNLDLEHRYDNTRIGTDLFSSARSYINKMGLIHNAPIYYQNSCRWMELVVKYSIEQARRCENISGYDLLGAIDCHWHRSGYGVGLLNEFYELKSGMTVDNIMKYNGESVLLAEVGLKRNLTAGQQLTVPIFISLYGENAMETGALSWRLVDDRQKVYAWGEKAVYNISNGCVTELGVIEIEVPVLPDAKHLMLQIRLSNELYDIANSWDYWVYPATSNDKNNNKREVKIVTKLDPGTIDFISDGGRVLLQGSGPFPGLDTTFQIMSGGRVQGNNATVIHDHPLMRDFPQDGYCDWQFYSMIEGASTVVFNDLDIPFQPIVEIVSSYKMIRKQASLFELGIGKGGLLVSTLNLSEADAGAAYLKDIMLRYIASDLFVPKVKVTRNQMSELLLASHSLDVDFSTDEAYDKGGHIQM